MSQNKKPRDFSYINHKDNYPLELKGNMKRRPETSIGLTFPSSNTMVVKEKLALQIMQNYQQLKSAVPLDFDYHKARKQSLRVYDRQQQADGSGAVYLMGKSQDLRTHAEKRHLPDKSTKQNGNNTLKKEKRHFNQKNIVSTAQLNQMPKKHNETLYKKLQLDLYSQMQHKEKDPTRSVKMIEKTMFRESTTLGLQKKKKPTMSMAKQKEINGCIEQATERKRNYRGDWSKSNFVFGW